MRDKAYKFVSYTRKHGVVHAVRKSSQYIRKQTAPRLQRRIHVMADIADVTRADFVNNPYKTPPKKPATKSMKIGWVLSPLSAGSGGQNTILRFVRYLQSQGHDVTIYLYEGIHPQSVMDAKKILQESFKTKVAVKKLANYTESDAILATGWETAYPVFNLDTKAHKFYFVQDFEPLFYGLGSMAVLAQNTYKFNFYGITAGKWLTHKVSTEYGMKADYFDFGVDLDVYHTDKVPAKKKKICFYARPVTERRAFELGVIALEVFHKKHPEYEIEFFGWDVSDYEIPFPYVNRGIVSHQGLATLYQESAACLVLSLTNVSLLPFELLAGGCIPVMNEGDNNTMVLGQNDYIRYTGTSPVEIANGLSAVVENKKLQQTAEQAAESVKNLPWDRAYQKVEKILKREIFKS